MTHNQLQGISSSRNTGLNYYDVRVRDLGQVR